MWPGSLLEYLNCLNSVIDSIRPQYRRPVLMLKPHLQATIEDAIQLQEIVEYQTRNTLQARCGRTK